MAPRMSLTPFIVTGLVERKAFVSTFAVSFGFDRLVSELLKVAYRL